MDGLADQHAFKDRMTDARAAVAGSNTAAETTQRRAADPAHWLHHIPAILFAGLICGLLAAMFSISAAALLFSNVLGEHIAVAIGICLFGTIVLSGVIAIFSSCPGMVSCTQEVTVVTFAVIATSIHATMFGTHSDAHILATIVVMIGLATAVTGLVLFAMGTFKLGRLIRFIPYPVLAGFLAGMGWLIVSGALAVVIGVPLVWQNMPVLLSGVGLSKWLPAVAFAVVVDVLARRSGNPLVLPVAVLASLILFHAGAYLLDVSRAELQQYGWLLQPLATGETLLPFLGTPLAFVDWAVIWQELPKMIPLIAISAAAMLFASSGIELSVRRDVDLDRELRAAGIANVLTGMGGGAAGFQGLGLTMLAHQLGAACRITGVLAAAVCAVILVFGSALLSLIPVPLFGGLLLWIGGALLYEWLIGLRPKISRREYLVVLLITVLIVTVGLLEGVVVGVFAAAGLFTIEYSRIDVIKYAVTGESFHSRIEHNDAHRTYLNAQGRHTLVLRLQGFIFFGSVHRLQQFIRSRLRGQDATGLRFLVLDCRDVTGCDSSALLSVAKIHDMIGASGGQMIVCNLRPAIVDQLSKVGAAPAGGPPLRCFANVDQAMAWCEERLLRDWAERPDQREGHCIAQHLVRELDHPGAFDILQAYLEKIELAPQTKLIRQDEQSCDIFFVEQGTVTVQLEAPESAPIHLRTLGPGTIVGEISFFLKRPRIAAAIAETQTTVWRLGQDNLIRMTKEEPEIASAFHGYLLRIVAERLNQTNSLVRSLTD